MRYRLAILILSLCILFALAGTVPVSANAKGLSDEPQLPIYSLTVTLGNNQPGAFFARLEKFAYAYGFADRIAPTAPNGSYLITMWREDLKIYATNSFDDAVFRFFFYQNNGRELPTSTLMLLIGELKNAVGEVPDTRITSEQRSE